jgi:steroid delta-isomerase-like uncharacterized protein
MPDETRIRNARYVQAYNDGDLDAIDETCTADLVVHQPPYPDTTGIQAHREATAALRQAFPDMKLSFVDQIVQGDRSVVRWTMTGTHSGQSPAVPVPPTGKQIRLTGCAIDRVVDGKVAETWNYVDYLGLLQQLGVVPSME